MNLYQQPPVYLYGEPSVSAVLRSVPEDFQVVEQLGFEPDGEGEHQFLYIRKRGENTDWVARQLAHFCQISPRDVSYAGKKDRHAVTEQWFSVHMPGHRASLNWKLFGGDSIEVLRAERHSRKLRLGALKGNRFELRLREVSDADELLQRFDKLKGGVPNYFGEQRFGHNFGNIDKGLALIAGRFKERQRHKKGLYISAVRSWLFNRLLSERIDRGLWSQILDGDVLMINGSQSCFLYDGAPEVARRIEAGELHLTGPLWGRGELMTQGAAREFEIQALAELAEVGEQLAALGLNQERRALRLMPAELAIEPESDGQWRLAFDLPAGAFATSVLRELCRWNGAGQD
ncbi:tRNA pseudouridine synthase D [Marinobacterium zhoushanense]|uniref:tRNA pseudouridine synthase D n=1 Tax=Marinobacterium zhoushanense TaxID=1679163 RepID=A0ABQ1KTK5_9GAMM|nr:tRNA pseudouridine(13) synthase TruD [Marinobacterium zhoushanense]GGC07989.1 tRNA pseudouridine synthase D [Marinobacterium zhoushanense]